jgi:iron-sulfur cluster repair protein YtfE (RIC family)
MASNALPKTDAARNGTAERLIAMQASHDAFRRDLEKMGAVATAANLRDPRRHAEIMNGWLIFKNQLLIHHKHEDNFVWPALRARLRSSAAAQSVLDEMDAEHLLIDPLLAAVDHAFAGSAGADAGDVIDDLTGKLSAHLKHEEHDAMPMIGEALSDKEWRGVVSKIRKATKLSSAAEFLPWLTDGLDAAQERTVASIMPPPARVVYRRIWKPKYAKVQHF